MTKEQIAKRAEQAFKAPVKRNTTSKQITEDEHATAAAKTKTLRALRVAKEAASFPDKGKSEKDH